MDPYAIAYLASCIVAFFIIIASMEIWAKEKGREDRDGMLFAAAMFAVVWPCLLAAVLIVRAARRLGWGL